MANVPSVLDWVLEASPPVALCGDEIVTPQWGSFSLPVAPRFAEVLIPSVNWRVMLHGVRKSILKQLLTLNTVKASKQKAVAMQPL